MAGTYNFTVEQFTDWTRDFTLTDANGAIDLTGAQFHGQLRASADGDMLAAFVVDITNAPAGKFRLSLPRAVTGALGDNSVTSGVHDLIMIDSTGLVRRLFAGTWVLSAGVTR